MGLLAQVGLVEDGKVVKSECLLPASKRYAGESPLRCLQRIMSENLAPFANHIVISRTEDQVQRKYSKKYSIGTKLVKTIYHGKFKEDFLQPVLPTAICRESEAHQQNSDSEIDQDAQADPTDQMWISSSASGSAAPHGFHHTKKSCVGLESAFVIARSSDFRLYAWLTDEDFERLCGNTGSIELEVFFRDYTWPESSGRPPRNDHSKMDVIPAEPHIDFHRY